MATSVHLRVLLSVCVICVGDAQKLPRNLKPHQREGRIPELDRLLERHISDINKERPLHNVMKALIKEAKLIEQKVDDKEMAAYYLRILNFIKDEGIDIINDERDRVHTIIQSTQGAERDYARYQSNVIEGIVDMAAEDVMSFMRDINPNMELWDDMDLQSGGRGRRDEV